MAAAVVGCGGGGSAKSTTSPSTVGNSAAQDSGEFCGRRPASDILPRRLSFPELTLTDLGVLIDAMG